MPPKRKVETVEDKTEVPLAKKTSEEESPPISPDKGATGETTSSENREAGTQTGLSEEEEEAHYKEEYNNAVFKLLKNFGMQNPELGQDIIIGTLYKQFARENRATRSKELIFSELDNLEAREAKYLETSGRVPDWLKKDMEYAQEDVEFENYVTLLKEARAHFGRETECAVIQYILKHKGEGYYRNLCMSCYKEK